jgi:hypothetical protein
MKRFELVTRRLKDRLGKVYDRAVVAHALRHRAFPTAVDALEDGVIPAVIDRFNNTAEWLDDLFGFDVRLEQTDARSFHLNPIASDQLKRGTDLLWRLCAERRDLTRIADLDWMLSLLKMMAIKPRQIERAVAGAAWSGSRDRKTKMKFTAILLVMMKQSSSSGHVRSRRFLSFR